MTSLDQFRQGLGQMWDNLAEGWQQLSRSARHALTRFNPIARKDNVETASDLAMLRGSRWGILAADVEEDDKAITVRLEAPGMEAEDFDIAVVEDYLLVRGEKHARREQRSDRYHVMECAYGSFQRAIPLPAGVDEDRTRAKYKRGVLTVTLPKASRHQKRRIEVKS